jgi:hypothetical protein
MQADKNPTVKLSWNHEILQNPVIARPDDGTSPVTLLATEAFAPPEPRPESPHHFWQSAMVHRQQLA